MADAPGTGLSLIGATARARGAAMAQAHAAERRAAAAWTAARAAQQRQRAGQRAAYAGAQITAATSDWMAPVLSADAEVRGDFRLLKARAREMMRNNPFARRYGGLCMRNVIGPQAVRLHMQARTTRDTTHDRVNTAIQDAWADFSRKGVCTVDGRLSMGQLSRRAVLTKKTEGEFLAVLVPGLQYRYGFAVQPIDADQLDDQYNVAPALGRNEVRQGVELEANTKKPVAYHIWTEHPADVYGGARLRQRVPAELVVYYANTERTGQTRGVTDFAPVMIPMRNLALMQEAVLTLQRAAACSTAWLQKMAGHDDYEDYDGPTVDGLLELEPLSVNKVPDGYEMKNWTPGQPGADYDPFTRNIGRECSAGLSVSYASLTMDLSQANYGSTRVGMLDERDHWETEQGEFEDDFLRPIFRAFLTYAPLAGALQLPGYDVDRYAAAAQWRHRGFDWIDPQKDITGKLMERAAGLTSLKRIAAEAGRDLDEVALEIQAEEKRFKELGIVVNFGTPKLAAAPVDGADATETPPDGAASGDSTGRPADPASATAPTA